MITYMLLLPYMKTEDTLKDLFSKMNGLHAVARAITDQSTARLNHRQSTEIRSMGFCHTKDDMGLPSAKALLYHR